MCRRGHGPGGLVSCTDRASSSPLSCGWRRWRQQDSTNRAPVGVPTGSGWEMPSPSPSVAACNTRDRHVMAATCDEHGDDPPARHDGDLHGGVGEHRGSTSGTLTCPPDGAACGTAPAPAPAGLAMPLAFRRLSNTRIRLGLMRCGGQRGGRRLSILAPSAVIRSPSSAHRLVDRVHLLAQRPLLLPAVLALLRDLGRARRASATRSMRASRRAARTAGGALPGAEQPHARTQLALLVAELALLAAEALPCCSPSSRPASRSYRTAERGGSRMT